MLEQSRPYSWRTLAETWISPMSLWCSFICSHVSGLLHQSQRLKSAFTLSSHYIAAPNGCQCAAHVLYIYSTEQRSEASLVSLVYQNFNGIHIYFIFEIQKENTGIWLSSTKLE